MKKLRMGSSELYSLLLLRMYDFRGYKPRDPTK